MSTQLTPDPLKNLVDELKEKSQNKKLTQPESELIQIYEEQTRLEKNK